MNSNNLRVIRKMNILLYNITKKNDGDKIKQMEIKKQQKTNQFKKIH